MNIFFHGASVTAQNKDGSYVTIISDLLKKKSDYTVNKMGYGGTHFNTAGILTFADDIKNKPDICFLDWNVTGLDVFNERDISYVVGSSIDLGVLPVFMIFARRDNLNGERECDKQIIRFCDTHQIPLIDMRPFVNPDVHLRDIVHTNDEGGMLYATKILDFILNSDVRFLFSSIIKKDYVKYSIYCQRNLGLQGFEGQTFSIDVSQCSGNFRVIVETVHGPESPVVMILPSAEKINFWDQWSHFERPGFVQLFKSDGHVGRMRLSVEVLSDSIDYSICNRPFSFLGEKKMVLNGVYGIDCIVDSVSILN
jgi:hypothetical protein